jgi:hypothetical protein
VDDSGTQSGGTHAYIQTLRFFPTGPSRASYEEPGAERGPDLAFIKVPKELNFARNLRAVRVNVYQLGSDTDRRVKQSLDSENALLAVVGAPGEWTSKSFPQGLEKAIERVKAGIACASLERYTRYSRYLEGSDYIDALITPENADAPLPESFRGVSGGALWRLRDPFQLVSQTTYPRSTDFVLAGVMFWEDRTVTPRFLRAHGPISLYEIFLPKLRNWLASPDVILPIPAGGINPPTI